MMDLVGTLIPDWSRKAKIGVCPFCDIIPTTFRDERSWEEFRISGLCQSCQDDLFKESKDVTEED